MIEKDKLQSINIGGLVSAIWKLAENMKASATAFIGLTDVPLSYAGQAQKFVKVNASENGLEFVSDVVGTVVDFAGSSAPTGWLICDGATISKTTYAALFAITGHAYGADPGGGNFILPDCRGKATVGYKSADSNFGALGNVAAGEKTHILTEAELAQHAHGRKGGGNAFVMGTTGGINLGNYLGSNPTLWGDDATGNAGSGTAHNNIQPSIVFNKIIKY